MSDRAPRAAPISLRLPEPLRNRIAERAAVDQRNFHAHCLLLLELGEEAYLRGRHGVQEVDVFERPPVDGAPVVEPHPVQDAAAGMGDHESPFPPPQLEEIGKPPAAKPFKPDFKEPVKKKEGRRR